MARLAERVSGSGFLSAPANLSHPGWTGAISYAKFIRTGHNNPMKNTNLTIFLTTFLLIFIISACAPQVNTALPVTTTPEVVIPSPTPAPSDTPAPEPSPTPTRTAHFSFAVTTDMSHVSAPEYIDYPNFFAGLLGYVKRVGPGDFMISLGDVIPAAGTRWTIDQVLGENYLWYPIPGNHDFGREDIAFLQAYNYDPNGTAEPNLVNAGPASCPHTTYSFDFQNAHFVALNVYCNEESPWGIDGSITDPVYEWLAADLAGTQKEHIFVYGHEPAFPQGDDQTGITRHWGESLDQYPEARDRFWELLKTYGVKAYFNGHTHGYSALQIDGVWQIDAGHAAGTRAGPSPGTFLMVSVNGDQVTVSVYRGEASPGFGYQLVETLQIAP